MSHSNPEPLQFKLRPSPRTLEWRFFEQSRLGVTQQTFLLSFVLFLFQLLYQPAHHRHTSSSAPNNTCTTHPSHQTGTTHASVHPLPVHQTWKTHDTYTSPTPRHTNLHTTFSYTHEIPSRFTTQYHTKKTFKLISNFPCLLQRSTPRAVTYVLFSWRWA